MRTFATDEEIKWAAKLLIGNEDAFNEEKKAIIKCNETVDVQACPGSGKTTTLLAKLAILSRHMPLADGRGICVLTHTNVAINEIKSKLGPQADILFSYPSFFGTIQKFADTYVGIPVFQ